MAHSSGKVVGTKNSWKIFSNIFISFIGAGILGLPYAFKEAGAVEGAVIMTFVGIISTWAMLLIIDCKDSLIERGIYRKLSNAYSLNDNVVQNGGAIKIDVHSADADVAETMSYGDLGYCAFGSLGRSVADASIVVSQIGFCCAYLIFISHNMSQYLEGLRMWQWLCILLPPMFLLTLFRHLKHLGYTSIFAQGSNLLAFVVVLWFDYDHLARSKSEVSAFRLSGIPFFSAVAIYCYEGAGMIISLESSVHISKRPHFRRYFLSTLTLVTLLYIVFGVSGYLSFGSLTQPIITLNLPKGSYFDYSLVVKACLCLSMTCTYPVMMFPVTHLIEAKYACFDSIWKGNILRLMLVSTSGLVVLVVPNFANLMGFVGAGCCNILAFILPGLFHMKIHAKEITRWQLAFDVFLVIIGLFSMVVGLWDTVHRMHEDIVAGNTLGDHGRNATSLTSVLSPLIVAVNNTVPMQTLRHGP